MENGLHWGISMREKSECQTHAGHVRGTTEMCSRDLPVLHPALAKANCKTSSLQSTHHNDSSSEGSVLPTPGGRLKFFKDGKFILELSHRRDGERTTWFPVPKKTFWPPASTTPNRQESSTSLSVSDDNSSVQSSPWQRDHCWKQSHPRRSVSTEFNFYFRRHPRKRLCMHPRLIAKKRRQPFDSRTLQLGLETVFGFSKRKIRETNGVPTGRNLNFIIEKLLRLLDPNVISPRKRILRELERVSLEDQASKRRATPQPTNKTTNVPTPSIQSPKQLSSYSITSILGEDKPSTEPGFLRTLLKPEDQQTMLTKYSSNQPHPSARIDPFIASANSSMHHPLYGIPLLTPGSYRAPLWVHYSPPVQYPPPMSLYAPPPHPSSPPALVHHYKDYREQSLTPPSDMPLNLSKHAG